MNFRNDCCHSVQSCIFSSSFQKLTSGKVPSSEVNRFSNCCVYCFIPHWTWCPFIADTDLLLQS